MYLGFVVVTGLKFHVDDWREKKRMMGLVHVDEVLWYLLTPTIVAGGGDFKRRLSVCLFFSRDISKSVQLRSPNLT